MADIEPQEILEYLESLAPFDEETKSARRADSYYRRNLAAIAQIKLLLKISEQLDGLGTALADLQVEMEIQRD